MDWSDKAELVAVESNDLWYAELRYYNFHHYLKINGPHYVNITFQIPRDSNHKEDKDVIGAILMIVGFVHSKTNVELMGIAEELFENANEVVIGSIQNMPVTLKWDGDDFIIEVSHTGFMYSTPAEFSWTIYHDEALTFSECLRALATDFREGKTKSKGKQKYGQSPQHD